jgi:hypothetical protein
MVHHHGVLSLGLYIKTDGKVGIGTSSPETKLHVKDGIVKAGTLGSTNGTLQFAGNYSGNNILNTYGSQYSTGATCIGYAVKQKSGSSGIVSSAGNSSFVRGMLIIDNKLEFLSADASTTAIDNDLNLTSRFFINAAGNVGIGTTAPDSKLQVIQSSNENWATKIYNGGGSGKGLLIQAGWEGNSTNPILQLEDANNNVRFFVASNGRTVINGKLSTLEVEVKASVWPDFVFEPTYNLKPLEEVEQFIKTNKHLPDVPSEKEVKENGLSLGQSDAVLLQKIEELTLYLIEQNKEVKRLKTEVGSWKTEVKELKEAKVEAEKEVERLKGIEEKYEAQQSVLIDLMKRIERLETNN